MLVFNKFCVIMILPNRNAKKRKSIFRTFGRELAVGESKCM